MAIDLSHGNGAEPAESTDDERLAWRTFRPPPALGLLFGAVYGAIAGAIIAYDVTVLIRLGRVLRARIQGRHAD
ncbi:MAG: hypothetical protein WEE64_02295 [Dehalococcoidia bacterium]